MLTVLPRLEYPTLVRRLFAASAGHLARPTLDGLADRIAQWRVLHPLQRTRDSR